MSHLGLGLSIAKSSSSIDAGGVLGRLGIISHFRNYPRQDGTLLSVIGNEERPLQDGRCYVFDGTNDRVELTSEITMTHGSSIKWQGKINAQNYQAIASDGSGDRSYLRFGQGADSYLDQIYGETKTNGDAFSLSFLTALTLDTFYEFEITLDNVGGTNNWTLYLDGVLQDTDTTTDSTLGINWIGAGRGGTDNYNGSMMDMKISTASTFYHYKMDEQEGLTAYDSSGNGNHAEITNATLSSFHGTQGEYSFQNQVGYTEEVGEIMSPTLNNGGFEDDTTGWIIDGVNETIDTSVFYEGSKSGKINIVSGAYESIRSDGLLRIGFTYTVSLYVKISDASKAARVDLGSGNNNYLSFSSTDWELKTVTGVCTTDGNFRLARGTGSGDYTVNFDSITVIQVESVFLPRDESTPSQDVLGNPLQHRGQAKLIAKARENSCATFDGSNDQVLISTAITLDADFDISCYISVGSASDQKAFLGDSTGPSYIRTNNSSTAFNIRNDNSTSVTISNNDGYLNLDQIYLFRITRDASNLIKIYIDGVAQSDTETLSGDIVLDIIGTRNGGSNPFDGKIFDVSITKAGTLQGHWPLSEGAGTVIHDISPNANHGTATNITQSSFWGSTQDEYATNFVDGFTPYFTEDDTLIVAGQTLTDISFTYNHRSAVSQLVLFSDSVLSSVYLFIAADSNSGYTYAAAYGTPAFTIDGVAFTGNRGDLWTLLSDNLDHAVVISNITHSGDLYFGGFGSYAVTSQIISNLKVNGIAYDGPTRVPAKSSTLDAYGNALTNPASPTHNGFEGVLDYREVGVLDATPPALNNIYTGAAEFDGVSGSYASVPDADNLEGFEDFSIEVRDVYQADWAAATTETFLSKYSTGQTQFLLRRVTGVMSFQAYYDGVVFNGTFTHGVTGSGTVSLKFTRTGTNLRAFVDTGSGYNAIGSTLTAPAETMDATTADLLVGAWNGGSADLLTGRIGQARIWDNATGTGTPVLDIDFRKFNHRLRADYATSGQLVTLNGGVTFPKVVVPDALAYDDTYPKDFCEFDGVSGSYVSVPFSVDTGDAFEVIVTAASDDWARGSAGGGHQNLFSSSSTDLIFRLRREGGLALWLNGTQVAIESDSMGLVNGQTAWLKATGDGAGNYTLEYSTDGTNYTTHASSSASPTTGVIGSFYSGQIGGRHTSFVDSFDGQIIAAKWTSGANTVLDIDFSTANARNNLAETGQILTYNGGAAIPLSTLANPMFQRDDSWTRLFEVGLNDSDAAKQI